MLPEVAASLLSRKLLVRRTLVHVVGRGLGQGCGLLTMNLVVGLDLIRLLLLVHLVDITAILRAK